MRIGSTLLMADQVCIQSYNWRMFRPLGSLQLALNSLDEFECDEVVIIRPIRDQDCLDNFKNDIRIISSIKTMTPLCFGGGIRDFAHLNLLKNLPIERLVFSTAFIEGNSNLIKYAVEMFGNQAIQCLLPIRYHNDQTMVFNSIKNMFIPIKNLNMNFIDDYSNEIILYDVENDGYADKFNQILLRKAPFSYDKLIITGGIGKSTISWAKREGLASVLIDNKVLHKEYSIKDYKNV